MSPTNTPHLIVRGLTTRLGSLKISAQRLAEMYAQPEIKALDDPTRMIGVTHVHRFGKDEEMIGVASACILQALETCGLTLSDIGGIVATSNHVSPLILPGLAPMIADRLGCRHVRADTIGEGCGGLLQAVGHAAAIMSSPFVLWPKEKAIVIVAAEEYSRHVDTNDYKTRYIFSDGVAVFILVPSDMEGATTDNDLFLERVGWKSLVVNERIDALRMGNPTYATSDPYFRMETEPVVRFTRQVLETTRELFSLADWRDISIIPHQANKRLLESMRKQVPEAAFFYENGICTIGNTLNASTLFGLADVLEHGLLPAHTQTVALIPFGAGWLTGAILLKHH